MTNEPTTRKGGIPRISLDVAEQAAYRKELVAALPDREPVWVRFHLRPEKDGSVSVHVAQGAAQGLRVGTVGNRNLERLKEAMEGRPAKMKGLIEWSSGTPNVRFVPAYAKFIPFYRLRW